MLNVPQGLAVDSSGNILVADTGNNRVVIYNSTGTSATVISSFGSSDSFSSPQDVAVTSSGFYVTDENNNRIVQFDSSGNFVKTFGSSNLSFPIGIATDSAGNVYVADSGHSRIAKFDSTGTFLTSFTTNTGSSQFFPTGVAVDRISGNVYVTDPPNSRVAEFNNTGSYLLSFGSAGVGLGQFSNPQGIAVDPTRAILVTDLSNGRIEKFDSNGTLVTIFGSFTSSSNFSPGQFNSPTDVAADSTGNVYVTDTNFNNISVFTFSSGGSPPLAPTGLVATALQSGSVTLSWTASVGSTSYTIYSSPSATGAFTTIGGTTTNTFTDTPSSLATYYEVSATSPSGQSGFSNMATPSIPASPPTPTSVIATPTSSSSITVSWAASTGATSYTIYRSVSPLGPFNIMAGTSASTSFTDIALSPSTTYYYEISASNTGGTSPLSVPPTSAMTFPLPPPTPTSVIATPTSSSSITVSWAASTGATSYTIYRSVSPLGPFTVAAGTSTTTSFVDTGLLPSTTYYYEISASNTGGTSPLSMPPTSAMTLKASVLPPPAPTSVTAVTVSSSSITVSWAASTGATSYTIYRSVSPLGPFTVAAGTSTTTSFVDTGLLPSTAYFYEVTASNSGGTSSLSFPPAYAITLTTCPPAPTTTNILEIGSYTIFGIHGVHLESAITVKCGNVGEEPLNDEIHVEANSRLAKSGIVGSNVHVEENATIYQAFYSRNLHIDGSSVAAPVKMNLHFISLPTFFPAVGSSTSDMTIDNQGSAVLPIGPATYGKLTIGNNARLEFTGGNYTFDSMTIGNYSSLVFDGPTTIHVRNDIDGEQGVAINPAPSRVDSSSVLIYVGKQVDLEKLSTINANIYALQKIHFGQDTLAMGAFIASDIHIERGSIIDHDYGFPLGTSSSN